MTVPLTESRFDTSLPELSWSVARHALFYHCRRAYYYYYYAAWGAWDRYADPRRRKIYQLKQLQTVKSWRQQVFRTAINDWFKVFWTGKHQGESGVFLRQIGCRLHADWQAVQSKAWQDDPKQLNLQETYYREHDEALLQIFARTRDELLRIAAKIMSAQLIEDLKAVPYLQFEDLPNPRSFEFAGTKIWLAPDLAWSSGREFHLLSFYLDDAVDNPNWSRHAALAYLFAEQFSPGQQPVIHSVFAGKNEQPAYTVYAYANRGEIHSQIREDNMLMQKYEAEGAGEEDYQVADESGKCESCRFREVCRL